MSLADEVAELRRRVADMVRRGVVDEVIPGSPVMVRVDIGDVLSPPLPWIQVQSGRYMQVSNYPAPGDAVTVISEAGDLRNGRVYPGANIDAIPVPEGSEYEHVILFDTGTEIRYDRQANALSITLAEGGSYKITGRGTLDGPVEITDTLTVQGKATMNAEAVVKADLMVGGEVS
ncbi:phage baseplate assembly protein V, partial [Escherichia coli]